MYIAQGYKGNLGWWKYTVIPILFLGLIALNHLAVSALGIDVESLMKSEIEAKGKNRFFAEMLLPFAFFLAVLLFWVRYVHQQPIVSLTTSRKKIDWSRFWFGFGLIAITTIILTTIDYYTNPQDYVWQFEAVPFLIMAAIAILLVPLQTAFEEYMFRGYLMQGIGILVKNRWIPLLLTSVIFGALHYANPEVDKIGSVLMYYYIGTGLFLGIITLMDEGLELALGFHAGNNLIAALLVTADWTVFQTNSILKDISEPSAGFDIFLPLLVVYPIFLLIMARKYRWNNWSEKLFGKVEKPIDQTNSLQS